MLMLLMLLKENHSQGRFAFYQAKEMGINCLYRKQIQQGVPMPAHLINQCHPHPPTAAGHGKESN